MKIWVSIPEDVLKKAEWLARHSKRARSELFSAALSEYVARHDPGEVTQAMNRVCALVGDQTDEFIAMASRRVRKRSDW